MTSTRLRIEIHLGRLGLVDVVAPVIHGVDEGLAERRQGIAHPAADLTSILLLLEMVRREIFQIVQAVAKLIDKRTTESPLLLNTPSSVRGELDDLDLRAPKPLHRIAREEEQTRVLRHFVVVDLHRDPHAPIDLLRVRFVEKTAPNVAQEFADLCLANVLDPGIGRPTIIPGHASGLLDEGSDQVAPLLGIDGRGAETDPVAKATPEERPGLDGAAFRFPAPTPPARVGPRPFRETGWAGREDRAGCSFRESTAVPPRSPRRTGRPEEVRTDPLPLRRR